MKCNPLKSSLGLLGTISLSSSIAFFSSTAYSAPTTFVHLFEWSWNDVAAECESFLGPKGYAAVQVSPPQEHVLGGQWWTRYQPVSYELESRGGNREEFKNMVQRCKNAGVGVYADAIINHMAAGGGVGTAGNNYGNRQYPIYSSNDFHAPCSVDNYFDRGNVQNCELVGLADLNTGDQGYVQNTIAAYLNDLIDLGVSGLRLDAAKHIPANDIAGILSKVNGQPFIFQEVIDQGNGEAVSAAEYASNGLITEFKYSIEMGNTFREGRLAWLSNFGEGWGFMPSHQAVVFVDNHDNQRGHGGGGNVITFEDGRLYDLANVFMLAYPYGYPKVMSSYAYNGDTERGGPNIPVHNGGNLECFESNWQCEHRWSYIAGAMDFRNNTNDAWSVDHWWDNGNNRIAFSRGKQGFMALNKEEGRLTQRLKTGLSEGTYCNVLKGELSGNGQSCSGETLTVDSDGFVTVNIAPWDAVAIHHNAKIKPIERPENWQRTVVFVQAETQAGQDMFVRGGIDHNYASNSLNKNCTSTNYECAIPIRHNNLLNNTTAPWKANDRYLDWYGVEAGQNSQAEGSAMDWTTNAWPAAWGTEQTVINNGFGADPLNNYGPHYWMLDVEMDCNRTANGWFELKAYIKNGQGWEGDIDQGNAPYPSNNHFAQCGKVNVIQFNANAIEIKDF